MALDQKWELRWVHATLIHKSQDAWVHVLTALLMHTAPTQRLSQSCMSIYHCWWWSVKGGHPASCLCEEAGLPFVRNKHHDNSDQWEQEMQRADRNTHRCQTWRLSENHALYIRFPSLVKQLWKWSTAAFPQRGRVKALDKDYYQTRRGNTSLSSIPSTLPFTQIRHWQAKKRQLQWFCQNSSLLLAQFLPPASNLFPVVKLMCIFQKSLTILQLLEDSSCLSARLR